MSVATWNVCGGALRDFFDSEPEQHASGDAEHTPARGTEQLLLREWLNLHADPDVLCVALQEVSDLEDPAAYMPSCCKCNQVVHRARAWGDAIQQLLQKHDHQLRCVHSAQLVGIALLVFAKKNLQHTLVIDTDMAGTGPCGLGNKGAIVAHLQIGTGCISFVSCHLAAGAKGPHQRNAEFWALQRRLNVPGVAGQAVVWAGDLNYKVAMPKHAVRQLAMDREYDQLLAADELHQSMANKDAFVNYQEAPCSFPPTYKYDKGSDQFDTSKKLRAPAWCDRILWKSDESMPVKHLSYTSHELKLSDHRPVSALLAVTLPEQACQRPPKLAPSQFSSLTRSVCPCLGNTDTWSLVHPQRRYLPVPDARSVSVVDDAPAPHMSSIMSARDDVHPSPHNSAHTNQMQSHLLATHSTTPRGNKKKKKLLSSFIYPR